MKIKTKELLHKLAPYDNNMYAKVHNCALLMKERVRRMDWRAMVLRSCDNAKEYFPPGEISKWDWTDNRFVHMPKKWRVPQQVFNQHTIRYVCYHIIRHGKGLKVVRLKNVSHSTRITLRKGVSNPGCSTPRRKIAEFG